MRDIKFRAWDKEKKKFIRPKFGFWPYEKSWANEMYLEAEDNESLPLNTVIFLQYTGLKDKNGKEIYEGDIVKDISFPRWIWEIYFDKDEAKFWCRNENSSEGILGQWNASDDPAYPDWDDFEVIGNIYENPELLK